LKSNGLLFLIWNETDDRGSELSKNIAKYIASYKPTDVPNYVSQEWKKAFDNQNFFSPLQYKQFTHQERIAYDLGMKRILSISFIASLPSEQQKKVVDDIRKMVDDCDEMRDLQEFDVYNLTQVYWCSSLK